ncbi:Pentatricopeptide repeat-containing protein [Thalictrum thalictroides]|uniref:Pentatricopeptide repeat-containing protein n=1 Tax=Thalictrum thalictroides TaxID=46969 RepID=A0A7J6V615_THATH|nr:Pentatricopeptide repeat-containing protein [Thalictrum thalictroides]
MVSRSYNSSSSSIENYWKILQSSSNDSQLNLEKTLTNVRGKLDSSTVEIILKRCSINRFSTLLGLRFFIWAGLRSDYRHTSYMFNKACKFFEIHKKPQTLSDVLESYRKENGLVSVKTFKVILNLCGEAKLADEGLGMLRKMGEFGCRPDTTIFNVVIRMFSDKGGNGMDVAQGLMKEMGLIDLYPDLSTYIAMIKGFCRVGRLDDACRLIEVMRDHGCVPNVVVYSTLLDGFCKIGNFDRALEFLCEMEEDPSRIPNVVTYTSLIQSFCEKGKTKEALTILVRMESRGCFPNRVTVSTLLKQLCFEENIEAAYRLIDKVIANGVVSRNECYSSLVLSLLQYKKMDEAKKLFILMLENQIKPDGLACSKFIKQLCLEGNFLNGFEYYVEMEKRDFLASVDSDIYSILLVGLCQQGHLVEATRLINAMVERKIKLKAPYANSIFESLQNSGERELASHLMSVQDHV